MRLNDVEDAIRNVLRSAEVFGAGLARREALVRSAMVEPILWSLGWRTWLPWECRPDFTLGRPGSPDYVLFNRDGEVVVTMLIRPIPPRLEQDRARLRERTRTMTQGIAVLTYGWTWEVYDLEVRTLSFLDRRVERLELDGDAPNNAERVAEALYRWLGKDRWW